MTKSTAGALVDEAEEVLAARRLPEALDLFRRAQASGADADRCAAGQWAVHMLSGEFERAWQQSDAIRRRGKPDVHRLWNGESLDGKRIILRCLHGYGDAVQFLRYAPQLKNLAARLIVEVAPRFVELAHCFNEVDEVVTWGEAAPAMMPEWDVQVEVMELPYLFRTQQSDLPITTRYLKLPAKSSSDATSGGPDSLQIGLVWSAGEWNRERAIPWNLLEPLLGVEGCEFWSLQGMPEEELEKAAMNSEAVPTYPRSQQSIAGLAAAIAELDLVITVDTLAAHLAGALNVPGWVLLQHEADWRWMHRRNDSPWYPSLRLFRQPRAGDWASVIVLVREALERMAAAGSYRIVA